MKQIPFSLTSENTIIGSILYNPEIIHDVIGQIEPHHFYDGTNRSMYNIIIDFNTNKRPLTESLILEYIQSKKIEIDTIRFLDYSSCIAIDLQPYIDIVIKDTKLRNLDWALRSSLEHLDGFDKENHDDLFTTIEKILSGSSQGHANEPTHIAIAGKEFIYRVTEAQGYDSIKTGYIHFDRMTGGLKRGHFIIMAGMPSHGKTAFALNIARNVAHSGKKVGILSLEQPMNEIFGRLLAQESGISYRSIEQEFNVHMAELYPHMQTLSELPIYLEDFQKIPRTINQIKTQARLMKKRYDIDLLVIDYLGRIQASKSRENKTNEIADISNELKSLALELNVPLITICTINRENAKRADHRPKGTDLRDSGTIEYDADEIFMLFYEYKLDRHNGDRNKIEVIIDKQRNGDLGPLEFYYDGPSMRFDNGKDPHENM